MNQETFNMTENNSLDKWYKWVLEDIKTNGTPKGDRTGTGTISNFGYMFQHEMKEGFPLLTSKTMFVKGVWVELLWFLGVHMELPEYVEYGRTNIKYLLDNKCYIWVGDAYKKYIKACMEQPPARMIYWMESHSNRTFTPWSKEKFIEKIQKDKVFAKQWGDLGPIYGAQWTDWNGKVSGSINQIDDLIRDLKNNPDSRRLMVTAWNPSDVPNQTLPPCHYGFQCYTRELSFDERKALFYEQNIVIGDKSGISEEDFNNVEIPTRELSLSWNQRSVDTPLGLPFNIASYAFLLKIIAAECNMVEGKLIGYLGDTHIYNDQLPFIQEQLDNPTFPLPKVSLNVKPYKTYRPNDYYIKGYKSAGKVNYPLSN